MNEPDCTSRARVPPVRPPRQSGNTSLSDRIVIDPDVVHARPAIRGTRMRVADVLSFLAAGASTPEILEDYP